MELNLRQTFSDYLVTIYCTVTKHCQAKRAVPTTTWEDVISIFFRQKIEHPLKFVLFSELESPLHIFFSTLCKPPVVSL